VRLPRLLNAERFTLGQAIGDEAPSCRQVVDLEGKTLGHRLGEIGTFGQSVAKWSQNRPVSPCLLPGDGPANWVSLAVLSRSFRPVFRRSRRLAFFISGSHL
jgi:hypothetical protein